MIVLYTDFGTVDPYVGQMRAVLHRQAPEETIVDLLHEVPEFDICHGAYLLPALAQEFAEGTVFLCVVDPGVGGPREGIVLEIDGRWYVGPDNGLFAAILAQGDRICHWRIEWCPPRLSNSFHGRDLFAPIAAAVARGDLGGLDPSVDPATLESSRLAAAWPLDLAEVIYVDHYGNAVSGWRGESANTGWPLQLGGRLLPYARTFSSVGEGVPFWFVNSVGLVEIAVNQGSAAQLLDIGIGTGFVFDS